MSDFSNRFIKFIKEDNAPKLEKSLFELQIEVGKMLDVISIHRVGDFWYAWYYLTLDTNKLPNLPKQTEQPRKRGRRKKAE